MQILSLPGNPVGPTYGDGTRMVSYPLDQDSVHLFLIKGRYFAFDVCGCVFLEIDEPMWNALHLGFKVTTQPELEKALASLYGEQVAESLASELEQLISHGLLFSPDLLKDHHLPEPKDVATLCVNLAQTCNLRCRYCYANGGTYGKPGTMTPDTARRTVDFFLDHAGQYDDLSLSFFGGEPLLNFSLMKQTVEYALQQAKKYGKTFRFNLTTNGTLLTPTVRRFLKKHSFGVIVSIDGAPDVQNTMRPFADGNGSYDMIRKHLDAYQEDRQAEKVMWTLRATFTRKHLHFADQVTHLAGLGFEDISVEPCTSGNPDLGIGWADLPVLQAEYDDFAERYLGAIRDGQKYSFFHFRVMMEQARQGIQRLAQCGAGRGYLAVSSEGELYPCHRLVGTADYQVGAVDKGITHQERRALFASAHVNAKELCRRCWARYICGGGCHACAIQFNGDIFKPYNLECELVKHRIELGAYLYAELNGNQRIQLSQLSDRASANRPHLRNA